MDTLVLIKQSRSIGVPFLNDKDLGEGNFGLAHWVQVERSYQHFGCKAYHEASYRVSWTSSLTC